MRTDINPHPVVLDYQSSRKGPRERFPLRPRKIIGLCMLCGVLVGIVMICICSSDVPQTGDLSIGDLCLGIGGLLLVMLVMPGAGLVFEGQQPANTSDRRNHSGS